MENKELKKSISAELDDDVLEDATGGEIIVIDQSALPPLCAHCGMPRGKIEINGNLYCVPCHRVLFGELPVQSL